MHWLIRHGTIVLDESPIDEHLKCKPNPVTITGASDLMLHVSLLVIVNLKDINLYKCNFFYLCNANYSVSVIRIRRYDIRLSTLSIGGSCSIKLLQPQKCSGRLCIVNLFSKYLIIRYSMFYTYLVYQGREIIIFNSEFIHS